MSTIPGPFYAELREQAPVYRTPFDFWYVTRYDLANAVMRGDSAWSVAAASGSSHGAHHERFAFAVMARMLLTMDGVDHTRLRRLVFGYGLIPASIGTIAGLAAAFGVSRFLRAFLFEIAPTDPVTYAVSVVLVLAVTLLACYLPARRTLRLAPMAVLKSD